MHSLSGYSIYESSIQSRGDTQYFLVRNLESGEKSLAIMGESGSFDVKQQTANGAAICPLNSHNLVELTKIFTWLAPVPLGLKASAGFGDRLGIATPGHILAAEGMGFAPVFAQQSVRENARTGRTPRQVLEDAAWGVFEGGWTLPWGADADHLKTTNDLESFAQAGYTFFTIDPGEHVDNAAQDDDTEILVKKVATLPWEWLQSSPAQAYNTYLEKTTRLGNTSIHFTEHELLRAMAKYGKAVVHSYRMQQHLLKVMDGKPFDLEISVDETDLPTSVQEHYYISSELKRLGVVWTSMAPRFIGRFEKGVDYIGDLQAFEKDLEAHALVLNAFGTYKLSLHSGSDKFSVYRLVTEKVFGKVHLKTAGTSYLEALRVLAQTSPALFRQILQLGIDRYPIDMASYHVSARLEKVAAPGQLQDVELPLLLDQFDARQVLHVTYGSALAKFGQEILSALRANEELYYQVLKQHFRKHLEPLVYQS
ncbi:MAG TPA: tagaturonate epimerase family protein [Anaerolineaceae bacterium]